MVRHMPRRGGTGFYSYLAPPYKLPRVGRDPVPGVPYGSPRHEASVGDVFWHTPRGAIGWVGDDNGINNNNRIKNKMLMPGDCTM